MAKKILIVEDEQSVLRILSEKLTEEGFEVIRAKNGKEGLIAAKKHHPDLILLDVIMPVMDGMTMLKKLREDEWGKTAKITILTNLSDGTVAEAVEQNVNDYLVKSDWKLEDVVKKVKARCE